MIPELTDTEAESRGFTVVAAERGAPVRLSMQQLFLTGCVLPVGARLLVRHTFCCSERKPIEVVYSFVLPRDAALRRFKITGEGFSVRSELKRTQEAVAAYEKGLEEGHLASLARQYRDGLVNLAVGNLRPEEAVTVWLEVLAGVELRDEGFRFRFPFTLAPSYHRRARMIAVEDGVGEIELPAGEFDDLLLPAFRADAKGLHEIGFDLSVRAAKRPVEIGSPSHAIRVRAGDNGAGRVCLAAADVPNRDLVLEVRAGGGAQVLSGRGEDGKSHFAVTVPSTVFGEAGQEPRSVVFLLDRSGSMSGVPLEQAKKALSACLGALGASDRFGLVVFDDRTETFAASLVAADADQRQKAADFLSKIDARGGTELAAGVKAAAKLLKGQGGDIFVLTDGQVFGTDEILAVARATGFRLHCLGIGSASQDRFLAMLGRETGGVSRFVTPRERVDITALELFASVSRPVARNLKVRPQGPAEAVLAPEPPSQAFRGTPVLLLGEAGRAAPGELLLEWEGSSGPCSTVIQLEASSSPDGETLRLLRGARLITDLEARIPEEADGAAGRRERDRFMNRLEALSREYGLASQAMALVAVVERPGDRPGEPPQTLVVPVGLPQDMEFGGVFGTPIAAITCKASLFSRRSWAPVTARTRMEMVDVARRSVARAMEDHLVMLAARLEPDGGMPGADAGERILATLVALLAFAAEGNTLSSGAFRAHMGRMVDYLEAVLPGPLSAELEAAARAVVRVIREERPVPSEWGRYASDWWLGVPEAERAWREIAALAAAAGQGDSG